MENPLTIILACRIMVHTMSEQIFHPLEADSINADLLQDAITQPAGQRALELAQGLSPSIESSPPNEGEDNMAIGTTQAKQVAEARTQSGSIGADRFALKRYGTRTRSVSVASGVRASKTKRTSDTVTSSSARRHLG